MHSSGTDARLQEACEQAAQVGEAAQQWARRARSTAQEALDGLKDSTSDYMDRGRATIESLSERLEDEIREKPLRSILIAAGAGCLAGFLWSHARRSRNG